MHIVEAIIAALGGPSKASEKTGCAQQTVSSWITRDPPEIPPWQRPTVLAAAQRDGKQLGPEALAYLASRERTPRARSEDEQVAA